ncbi:MAG: U32 family peptidase, partial [Sphaerochaetaceae bacterium]|nr:U32 family peptidase [Sphaerochaetaceae bacterium]
LDKVYFGINNIAHLKWIENTNVKVYSDIYFYLANREAALNFLDTKLNIVGGYLFLETVVGDTSLWPFIPQRVDKDFVPPLFISRTNFSRDSLGKGKKDGKYLLNQRDNKYEVISRGELTFLIKRN